MVANLELTLTPTLWNVKTKMCKLHPHTQIIWQRHSVDPFFKRSLNWHRFHLESSSKQTQISFLFFFSSPSSHWPTESLAWLRVLQHDLLCDSFIRSCKLATRLWSGTWDFRGVDVDARRTCCVIAAISQFGNIIEKVSCHAGDQTRDHVGCNLLFRKQGASMPRLSLFFPLWRLFIQCSLESGKAAPSVTNRSQTSNNWLTPATQSRSVHHLWPRFRRDVFKEGSCQFCVC